MNLKLKPRAFPIGTKVKAYARSNWAQKDLPISGEPKGASTAEAEVASDGSLEFAGLTEKTSYLAAAKVGEVWQYVAFRTSAAGEGNPDVQTLHEEQKRAETAEAANASAISIINLGTDWSAGDSVPIYVGNDAAGQSLQIKVGTAGSPDTTFKSPVRVSRTISVAESTFSGDGQIGLGAITGVTVALAASEGQALGGVFGAVTHSTHVGAHSQADAFALYGVGRSASDSTRTGGGIFLLGQRNHNEGKATGGEITVENNAAAGSHVNNSYGNTMGLWLTPRGSADSGAGVVIGHPTERKFKVGYAANVGSVADSTFRDDSSSTTSLDIRGEHTNSIKLAEAAGPIDLGKNSITNPGPLGNPYRILARASGNANTSAAEGNKYFLVSGQTNAKEVNPASTAAANVPYLIIVAGADMAGPGTTKMRIGAIITTQATPPGKTITVGLYPVTGAPTQTLGSVVAGSTLAFESPAKESNLSAHSSDFTPPADGIYAIGYTVSGTPAGGFALQASAEYHHV